MRSITFFLIAGREEFRGGGDLRERLDRMRSPSHNSPGRRDAKSRHTSHGKRRILLSPKYIMVTDFALCSTVLQETVLTLLGKECKFSEGSFFYPIDTQQLNQAASMT